jgi:hypothetical protein
MHDLRDVIVQGAPACIALMATALAATCAYAATYFVSPSGADGNGGTVARPFRTIQRAAEILKPGDTCYAREGLYRETVRPANSGEADRPITFAAYEDETVIVSGADPITAWQPGQGRIYRAATDWQFDQLFVDGQMMNIARWPNSPLDPMRSVWAAAGKGTEASMVVDPNLPNLDLNGAVMHILPGAHWVSWTRPIRDYDSAAHSFKFDGNWNQDWAHAVKEGSRYYLMGTSPLLDTPGEWCLDRDHKTVSLWTPQGDDPRRHRVEVKRRELAFDLSDRSHIRVEGFRVFAATISMANANHCMVRRCHVRYASHFTDCEGWGTKYHQSSGIVISGHDNQLRDSSVIYSAGNGVALLGDRNTVRNCLVRSVDYMAIDCGAVWAEGTRNAISRNTLCYTGRSVVLHRALKNGRIDYNDMHDAGLLTADLGITYCFGTDGAGTVIAYNFAHHNRAPSAGVGIYIDNGSSNFIIHHNVSWDNPDSGIRLNTPSHNNLVSNNTAFRNGNSLSYWGPNDEKDQAGCRLINNVFTDAVVTGTGIELSHNFQGKDPGFVDAGAADLRLRPDSPCIDAGIVVPGITTRFVGKAPDLGAYESGRRPWKAGHSWGEPPVF